MAKRDKQPAQGQDQLARFKRDNADQRMTSDTGVRIQDTDDSLKAGPRGPTLLEDFHLREKITRFDHERIPERVVHARGSGAHGFFQVYESQAKWTRAGFLQDPAARTRVFVRFSTVVGSRGAADTARDVRGFATRFYTNEGNFDLVGNNMPVFFIQDGIKFPDLVHAVKPEAHHEMPGGASAHDTFWDFASLVPESTHMLMWVLSDRAIPRSYAMMEGFGVHTFRLVNARGKSRFVKFHWKPLLGAHSLVWDEAQKLAGKDPDFHRRDLWESITNGDFPEYELGVQVIEERDADKYSFDLFDPTKLVPEELVPVQRIGKMTLDRNPDNFFAETEQVAFHVGNVVPGIDVTNDALMQARLFSYVDTQLTRLGGPNFNQIPINQPVAPVHNHQQDGFHNQVVQQGRANYHPNSIGSGCPFLSTVREGGYVHFPEEVQGVKARVRSPSFGDHYSQATLFYKSLTPPEQQHLIDAARFELGKVELKAIRERVVSNFALVDANLAEQVAAGIGVTVKAGAVRGEVKPGKSVKSSPSLSLVKPPSANLKGRMVAFLVEEGFQKSDLDKMKSAITSAGGRVKIVSSKLGAVGSLEGKAVEVEQSFLTAASVFFDAVFVPGGAASVAALMKAGDAIQFLDEAFRHCKTIGAAGEGRELLEAADIPDLEAPGIVTAPKAGAAAEAFIAAIAQHRHWTR